MGDNARTISILQQRSRQTHKVLQEHRRALRVAQLALQSKDPAEHAQALTEVNKVLGDDE